MTRSETSLASRESIEYTGGGEIPAFFSTGRWPSDGNSELGIINTKRLVNHKEAVT
jgi:hypothetical protein